MELKKIIAEYLDLKRKLKNGNLPESLERELNFRLADLDDILILESKPSTFQEVPVSDNEKNDLMIQIISDIDMYNEYIALLNDQNRSIFAEKELKQLEAQLKSFDQNKINNYLQQKKSIEDYSVERKKRKGGEYDYFIANSDGEVVSKISNDVVDFEQLDFHYEFFSYEIGFMLPEFETTAEYNQYLDEAETAVNTIDNKVMVESKVILNNNGQIIKDGIDSVIINKKDSEFILRLNDQIYFNRRPNGFNPKKDCIWCVIDKDGKYIIEPTTDGIRFNGQTNKYEFFNFIANR